MPLVSLRFPDFPLASVFPFHGQLLAICTDSPDLQTSRVFVGRIPDQVVNVELEVRSTAESTTCYQRNRSQTRSVLVLVRVPWEPKATERKLVGFPVYQLSARLPERTGPQRFSHPTIVGRGRQP